jgi:hypothetical protein
MIIIIIIFIIIIIIIIREPIKLGRKYAEYDCVDEFVTLPNAGHCPMDQIPSIVNFEILRFLNDIKK